MSYNLYATLNFVFIRNFDFEQLQKGMASTMESTPKLRKNPSREACESIIKRILTTEMLQQGHNSHFKTAADFMDYFESLYPASDALTKQVQRAVKALNMPKDESGYFIANKTVNQFDQEQEIRRVFAQADVAVNPMEQVETVFLSVASHMRSYLIHLLEESVTFEGKFLTILETSNGLLIYTENKQQLLVLLNSLTNEGANPNVD
jgi:hypothetical protein